MEKRVSKLSISTDDLERRENLAKRLNRNAKNRLRQQHEQFQDNHEFIESEINQEIRKLQDDLKGIREIGNYDVKNSTDDKNANNPNTGIKRKRNKKLALFQKKSNSRRSLQRNETDKKVKFYSVRSSTQLISVEKTTAGTNLVNLSRDEKPVQKNTQTRDSTHEKRFSEHAVRFDENEVQLKEHDKGFYQHEVIGHEKHELLPRITQSATQESKSRELDVHEARNQARKRLLGEHEADSNTQTEGENTADEDIESYMYVPPDGRKRTVYLLPPLEELLQEAKKARYLRIPKRLMTYEDDPERELSVDEIFSKSV